MNSEHFISKYYKQNAKKYPDYKTFARSNRQLHESVRRFPAINHLLEQAFKEKRGLQDGIISETIVAETLAKQRNLESRPPFAPKIRNYYEGEDGTKLIQYGSSDEHDITIVKGAKRTVYEVKQPFVRVGDIELPGYGEDGRLLFTDKFKRERSNYMEVLEKVNTPDFNIFTYLGHNINLNDQALMFTIYSNYFDDIDYIVLYKDDDNIKVYTIDEYKQHISFSGSELRTAGKNKHRIFTPKDFCKRVIDCGGTVNGRNCIIPSQYILDRNKRGINTGTTKKIFHIYILQVGTYKEVGDMVHVSLDNMWQLTPNLGVHVRWKD